MTAEERPVDDTVFTWPHLLVRHVVFALGVSAAVLTLGVAFAAPLRDLANPNLTPEPAKAPWYFVGLQELLSHFDPLVAGILVPLGAVLTLVLLPYIDRNPSTVATPTQSRHRHLLGPARPRRRSDGHRHVLPRPGLAVRHPVDALVRGALGGVDGHDPTKPSLAGDGSSAARSSPPRPAGRSTNRSGRSPAPPPAEPINLGNPSRYPPSSATYVPQGRLFVANTGTVIYALSQKCPHLGCRVPFCDSSGRFECPCHGSKYDIGGEWIEGPAPRGMDRFDLNVVERQPRRRHVEADHRPDPGAKRFLTPAKGPSCVPKALTRCPASGRPRRRSNRPPSSAASTATSPSASSSWSCSSPGSSPTACVSPALREDAKAAQLASYQAIGAQLFDTNCSGCHGKDAVGGSAPVLNSQEFLKSTTDAQISNLIAGGVPGTEMPAWSLAFSGTLTDEQIRQITTYLRSLEPSAPSVPTWRRASSSPPTTQRDSAPCPSAPSCAPSM